MRVSTGGRDVAFVQEDRRLDGSFYVIMPQPMPRGAGQELTVEYQGDKVVYNAGGGNFSVGARTSWYPSLNAFRDHSLYDLVFKVPKDYTLVSVGKLVKEWKEQNFACTEWSSDIPMAVAGFNYGDFKKKTVSDAQTGMEIDGYAAGQAPGYLQGAEGMGAVGNMTPARLLDQALVDAENAERVFNAWFGKSNSAASPSRSSPRSTSANPGPLWVYLCR